MGTAFDMHVDEGENKIGIIPRAVEHLFMGIEERRRKAQDAGGPVPEFTVNTQFMEVNSYIVLTFFSLLFQFCAV
jgi:kinesin family member 21